MSRRGAERTAPLIIESDDVWAVPPPAASSVVLPAETASVAAGRRFVTAFLDGLQLRWQRDEAVLLTSELLTNCIVHGQGRPRLAVCWRPPELEIAVTDDGIWAPVEQAIDLSATSGRGLQLVDGLALRSGTRESSAGTTIWFKLRMLPLSLPAPRNTGD